MRFPVSLGVKHPLSGRVMIESMKGSGALREWQRGVLSAGVLATLAGGATHGYAIAQYLQHAGIGPLKVGILYPVLNRLEADGLVNSHWSEGDRGPGKKVFELTVLGSQQLQSMREEWPRFATAVANLLSTDEPDGTRTSSPDEKSSL